LDDDNYLQENNILKDIYKEDISIFEKDKNIGAIKYSNDFDDKNSKKYVYINWLVTCWVLIKKEIFYKVWYFNESMNVYSEDSDLGIRIIKKWYDIILNNIVKIEHRESTENPEIRKREFRLYQSSRNWTLTILLNFNLFLFFIFNNVHQDFGADIIITASI